MSTRQNSEAIGYFLLYNFTVNPSSNVLQQSAPNEIQEWSFFENALESSIKVWDDKITQVKFIVKVFPKKQLHPCPYRQDLFGDNEPCCSCDETQMQNCISDL